MHDLKQSVTSKQTLRNCGSKMTYLILQMTNAIYLICRCLINHIYDFLLAIYNHYATMLYYSGDTANKLDERCTRPRPWPWIRSYCIPSCAYHRASLIDLYLHAKFIEIVETFCKRTDARTHVCTGGLTFENGLFILSKSRPTNIGSCFNSPWEWDTWSL